MLDNVGWWGEVVLLPSTRGCLVRVVREKVRAWAQARARHDDVLCLLKIPAARKRVQLGARPTKPLSLQLSQPPYFPPNTPHLLQLQRH